MGHIAGVTAAGGTRFFDFMVDELERFFAGHETLFDITPRTLANRRGLEPAAVTRVLKGGSRPLIAVPFFVEHC